MRTFIFCLATAVAVSGLAVNSTHAANSNENRAQQIASDLKQSGRLKDYRVGVKYEDGVAWLTGTVTDRRQKQIAEEVASHSPGVAHVVNKLEVENIGYEEDAADYAEDVAESRTSQDQKQEVASSRQASFEQRTRAAQRQPAAAPRQRQPAATPRQRRQRQPAAAPRQRRPNAPRRQAMAPRSNMPVPYARVGRQRIQPASFNSQEGGRMNGGAMQGMMQPRPMGGGVPTATGQAVSYDNPQMPGYAWPSYAASSNYAALSYPKQYSPSAWPYIGPFYPYPQVPLGWRKVTLEWDDGWWFLDFKDK